MAINKKVFYTCIFADYDILKEPLVTPGWDYVCFTDGDFKSDIWDIRKLEGDSLMLSRDVKINCHKYLPGYDEWFYFDGSITAIKPISINTPFSWLGYEHRCDDPYEEKDRILALNKGNKDIILKQLNDYSKEGVKPNLGHMAGGVLYRKNTPGVKKLNEYWWEEFKNYPSRDQISLYKILHKYAHLASWNYLQNVITMSSFLFDPHISASKKILHIPKKDGNIYEFTPSGIGPKFKDYGTALNMHCELVPNDEDWIIIRDQDTMYFPGNHRRIIREAITKYPDTGIFGAYTNRIGLKWQLSGNCADENTDIMHHYHKSKEHERQGSECVEVNKPIAGFFMMFRKNTWESIKFKEGDFNSYHDALFDWDFSQKVIRSGMKTRLIKGLYLFHFYRFQQDDIRDVNHLYN